MEKEIDEILDAEPQENSINSDVVGDGKEESREDSDDEETPVENA